MTEIRPAGGQSHERPFNDFGEMTRAERVTIAQALKERAARNRPSPAGFHLRMTLIGFLGGGVLIWPAVLWLTGNLVLPGLPSAEPAGRITADTSKAFEAPRLSSTAPPPAPAAQAKPDDAAQATREPRVAEPDPVAREALLQKVASAREMLLQGEVQRVRGLLLADSADPDAAFLLAEAYDPNVIASLNVQVRPEVELARRYYTQALIGGMAAARQRLEALQ